MPLLLALRARHVSAGAQGGAAGGGGGGACAGRLHVRQQTAVPPL